MSAILMVQRSSILGRVHLRAKKMISRSLTTDLRCAAVSRMQHKSVCIMEVPNLIRELTALACQGFLLPVPDNISGTSNGAVARSLTEERAWLKSKMLRISVTLTKIHNTTLDFLRLDLRSRILYFQLNSDSTADPSKLLHSTAEKSNRVSKLTNSNLP